MTQLDVEPLFHRARDLAHSERSAFLDSACGGDLAVRRRVEALLAADAGASGFLGEPEGPGAGSALPPSVFARSSADAERSGDVIDRYKLLEKIGEGGFGTVWMAEQREPVRRRVALKIVKLGMDTKQVVARFEAERQALALMDHPNIAHVFDAGATTTGRPYFAMEYIRGVPIVEYCDTARLDTLARLELFVLVCNAIQHAHHKGIVHRDIKPSNVLVTLHDGRPVPKVIDFGIAKATSAELTQRTLFTEHRQMIGTPAYMSPEQAEMSGLDIDTRSDIYSLGVLLYELLTGSTPFDPERALEQGLAEMLRFIREVEPVRPSTRIADVSIATTRAAELRRSDPRLLGTLLRGDLDWIVMKCLEKDRSRRYDSASGLAADIRRHLAHEPVSAGPPSAFYRMRKFARRHRVQFAAGLLVAATLVLGVVGTSFGLVRALDEKERADGEADRARDAYAAEADARREAEDAAGRAERELVRAAEVGRVLRETLTGVSPEIAGIADTELLVRILDTTSQRLLSGEITDESIAAELHHVVGRVYLNLGRYDRAERHLPLAAELHERLYGIDDERTLSAQHDFLGLRVLQGRGGEVESRLLASIEQHERLLGARHPSTLAALVNLATLRTENERHAEAAALLERANVAQRETLGAEHINTLRSAARLALARRELGALREAEALCRATLATQERVLGAAHTDTLSSWRALAILCRDLAHYEEAERIHASTEATRRAVFDEHHPNALVWDEERAQLLFATGHVGEAEELYEAVLATRVELLGAEHADTLLTQTNLAFLLLRTERRERAQALFDEVLATTRAVDGDEHPRTLTAMSNLALAYAADGRAQDAEELHRTVLEQRRTLFGAEHPATLASLAELAMQRAALGRPDEAATLLVEALEGQQRIHGDDHPATIGTSSNLALVFAQLGRLQDARELSERVLAVRMRDLGAEHPSTVDAMVNAAGALWDLGETARARELCIRVVDVRQRTLGPDDPRTLLARNNLALIVAVDGDLEGALAMHQELLATRRRLLGDEHPETVSSLVNAAATAEQLGRSDIAESAYIEALGVFERRGGASMQIALQVRLALAKLRGDAGAYDEVVRLLAPHLPAVTRAVWPNSAEVERAVALFATACEQTGTVELHAGVRRKVHQSRLALARRPEAPAYVLAKVALAVLDNEFTDLRDLDVALELAERACAETGLSRHDDDVACFETLALVRLARGEAAPALAAARRALEALPVGDARREAIERLAAEAAAAMTADDED